MAVTVVIAVWLVWATWYDMTHLQDPKENIGFYVCLIVCLLALPWVFYFVMWLEMGNTRFCRVRRLHFNVISSILWPRNTSDDYPGGL